MRLSAVWASGFLILAHVSDTVMADEADAGVAKPQQVAAIGVQGGWLAALPSRPSEGVVIVKAIGALDFNSVDESSFGDESTAH